MAGDGKNMVKGFALTKSVMKSDFDDLINPAIPTKRDWFDRDIFRIGCENNGNRNINMKTH